MEPILNTPSVCNYLKLIREELHVNYLSLADLALRQYLRSFLKGGQNDVNPEARKIGSFGTTRCRFFVPEEVVIDGETYPTKQNLLLADYRWKSFVVTTRMAIFSRWDGLRSSEAVVSAVKGDKGEICLSIALPDYGVSYVETMDLLF